MPIPCPHLTFEHLRELTSALDELSPSPTTKTISLDLSRAETIDSAGIATLALFVRRIRTQGGEVELRGLSKAVRDALAQAPFWQESPPPSRHEDGLFVWAYGKAHAVFEVCLIYLSLCADLFAFTFASLARPRRTLSAALVTAMSDMGSRALGVVGLIAFLVGATMALQGAAQLRQFGANIFVADLIGISVTRELGPLLTAVVVAGRSGSAVAAELATMRVSEEIDAIATMGLSPIKLLVVPKFLAMCLVLPLLTIFADAFAIGGAFLVAILYLDVSSLSFLERLQQAVAAFDVITGLIKSLAFAGLIVTIGAAIGLATRGGADEVGRSTTRSVVVSIFAVIIADAAFSMLFYFGG